MGMWRRIEDWVDNTYDEVFRANEVTRRYQGKEALEQGNAQKAFEIYLPLAEKGDADAQCKIALIYKCGWHDYAKAAYWYRKAAQQGHAESQTKLGFLLRAGLGLAKDDAEGARWYEEAARQGYAEAQYNLGRCYLNGEGVTRNIDKALKWFTRAAESGYGTAQYTLGILFLEGTLVPQDFPRAVLWFEKASQHADARTSNFGDAVAPAEDRKRDSGLNALYNLGQIYRLGKVVKPDPKKALEYYLRAAKLGDRDSQFAAGTMLHEGVGVTRDVQQALLWFSVAAKQGHEAAQRNLETVSR